MTREAAVQRWPVVPNADHRIPSVARSRSASARTTTPFLPPSSSERRLSRAPALAAIDLPVADDPVNEMTADVRGIDDRVTDLAAGAGHEVHDPGREPRLGHELHEQRGAMRRVAGRLEDHGVAGHEGRHHLPARDRHREVPGRDDARRPRSAGGCSSPTCRAARTAPCRRTSGVPRRPSGRRCRCLPGRRRGPPTRTLPISRVIARARRSLWRAMSSANA